MKNDIEWLKNEILELSIKARYKENSQREWHMGHEMALFDVNKLIDQLDEPETLSQEWIDENKVTRINDLRKMTTSDVVTVIKLKNLLVPKQDKPVIPQFVVDWYESEGKRSSWWNWFYKWGRDEHRTDLETKTIRWMQDFNEELFVDMFRFGYEVEEEQKYQVIIRDGEYIRLYLCKHGDNVIIGTNDNYIEKCPEVTYLTEQEIKDYDERYWAFAQEITQ